MEGKELGKKIEELKRIRKIRGYCWEVMERRKQDEIYYKADELDMKLNQKFGDILEEIGFFDGKISSIDLS